MKRTAVLILSLALITAVPADAAGLWKKSLEEAQSEARKKDRLMLVEMYASWCGWCTKMAQEVFPSEAFQKATRDLVLLQLNTEDGKEGTRISQELQIRSLPTLVLLTPDMMIAGVISGYAPARELSDQVTRTLGEWKEFEAKMARAASGRMSPAESLDVAKEVASRRGFAEARERFERISANSRAPQAVRSEAYYELARMQAYLGKHDAAISAIQGLRKVGASGDVAERGQVLLAEIYFLKKDYARSLAELRSFQSAHPESPLMENVLQLMPRVRAAASQ